MKKKIQNFQHSHVALGGHDDDEPGAADDEYGDEAARDNVVVQQPFASLVVLLERQRGDEKHKQAKE